MTFTVSDFKRIRANAQCTDGRRITLFFFMSATKTQCVEGEGCLLDKSKSNTAALCSIFVQRGYCVTLRGHGICLGKVISTEIFVDFSLL